MNEGFVIIVFVALIGVAYACCAKVKSGSCDIGKCFNLLAVACGAIIGVFLVSHALASVKAKAPYEDSLWTAIAGIVLSISSSMQITDMFREIFSPKPKSLEPPGAAAFKN